MKIKTSRKTQKERKKETRNKILNAAYKLFCEKGYYKTNTKEIAKFADIAIGSFYLYYKDKKDVLLDLINQYYISALKNITNTKNSLKSSNKKKYHIFEIVIDEIINMYKKSPELFQELEIIKKSEPEIKKHLLQIKKCIQDNFLFILESLFNKGEIENLENTAFILQTAVESIINKTILEKPQINSHLLKKELIKLIQGYLNL